MLSKTDQTYLERLGKEPVVFVHAVDLNGKATRLVRSNTSPSLQKHYHRLAVDGYCAEAVDGCGGHGVPPETRVTYSLTARGRVEIGKRAPTPMPVHRSRPLTEDELEREGIE